MDKLPQYDVILMNDILEHFEKSEGITLLKSLIKITKKAVIISTPQFPDSQNEYLGNRYEAHKSRWTNLDLIDFDFTTELIRIRDNAAQIFVIYPPKKMVELPIDKAASEVLPYENISLTIGYFLPHHNLTGGLKMLLEQMKHLQKRGHKIIAFYRGDSGESVLPEWYDLRIDKEVLVPKNQSLIDYLDECDICMAGWLEQIPELANAKIPIVYWEQGNEWIFGENLSPTLRSYLQQYYAQPVALASVSPLIAKVLKVRYNRSSRIIPNGIDTDFYYPAEPSNKNIILLVGNPFLSFKGFDIAIRTLIRVWKLGYRFKVRWVCQEKPQFDDIPFPFPIEYFVNPSQVKLAEIYRSADLFLFTSWYEGFGMPPLEAMASGVPVVSTRCGGIEFFMEDDVNAILAEPGDFKGLAEGVISLINNQQERERLSRNGRDTALKLKFTNIIQELEQYLIYLVKNNIS